MQAGWDKCRQDGVNAGRMGKCRQDGVNAGRMA